MPGVDVSERVLSTRSRRSASFRKRRCALQERPCGSLSLCWMLALYLKPTQLAETADNVKAKKE
jgi:hypothetical protein